MPIAKKTSKNKQNITDQLSSLLYAVEQLPSLPKIIRFEDDYENKIRTIKNLESSVWRIQYQGKTFNINFYKKIDPAIAPLLKHYVAWALSQFSPKTLETYFYYIKGISNDRSLITNLLQSPHDVKKYWDTVILSKNISKHFKMSIKSLLFFMCDNCIGQWTPSHSSFIVNFTYNEKQDKYRLAREGEVFLSTAEEIKIISFFDEINHKIKKSKENDSDLTVRDACLLYWSYQHAFRPIQIASVNLSDVKIRKLKEGQTNIHINFLRSKQRSSKMKFEMRRRMKREWTPMMERFYELRTEKHIAFKLDRPNSLFGLTPTDVSNSIRDLVFTITSVKRGYNDLRHTAAQRLVDAGASQVELAEFMGHAQVDTGLVYFDISHTQAERVNKALGLSSIYSRVSDIANKLINQSELEALPPAKQIGAMPHGIPAFGIGGCDIGQPQCVKNPALSCYTCNQFLPLAKSAIHQLVLSELQQVIYLFVDAGRNDGMSPAYMQLRKTMEAIYQLLDEIDEK